MCLNVFTFALCGEKYIMKVQTLPRGVKKHPQACAAPKERVVGPVKVEQHALLFVVSGKNSQPILSVDL